MRKLNYVFLAIVVLGAAVVTLMLVTNLRSPQSDKPTRKMAERLRKIAENADPAVNKYINDKRLTYFQRKPQPRTPIGRFELKKNIGVELLHSGKSNEAVQAFSKILADMGRNTYGQLSTGQMNKRMREFLAISHLRMGEQDNCVFRHTTDACILPIRGTGIHLNREGSEKAIEVYKDILNEHPNDFTSGWLLNVSYMTLGEYPDHVPHQWLIPPKVFKSDYDIKRFYDRAPELGLDVIGLVGGCIMEDFDNDGYLDIMASSNGLLDQLRFFRNNGNGAFTDVTLQAGLSGIVGGINLCHADYNNDGHTDVFVLRGGWMDEDGLHPNSLLHNNGDGTFKDVTENCGLLSFHPSQTASWGDYDNDGWLDLYIGNESFGRNSHPCELYHNNGDGTFTNVADEAGVAVSGYVKGVSWGDYNNDGLLDLYISRLLEWNLLLKNNGMNGKGEWTFSDVTEEAGTGEPLRSFPTWFWDYNNDGWLDIFVSGYQANAADVARNYMGMPTRAERPRLYRNNHDGTFADVSKKVRVDKVLLTMGCNFGDLDNDGFLDFYAGTGAPDFRSIIPNRMFRNRGGEYFQDVTTSGGFGHLQKGHGVSFGDIDNDGDQDIYMVIGGMFTGDMFQNALFENPGHGHHWITLRLEGARANRSAIGARIKITVDTESGVRQIHRTVTTGGSFGSSSLQQEIGLENAIAIASIEIHWPGSRETQVFSGISLDRIYKIREDDPELIPMATKTIRLSGKEHSTQISGDH
ncbi:CRTAC1 family protein [bacterium]|nr:CRTAC1 family protein [bacterium]